VSPEQQKLRAALREYSDEMRRCHELLAEANHATSKALEMRSTELVAKANQLLQDARECTDKLKEAALPKLKAVSASDQAIQEAWTAWLRDLEETKKK